MSSGLPNQEKSRVRKLYAEGKVDRDRLLAAESSSYHSAGTCTFYGTANSNQMLMEVMGLHLPGASFIPPGTPLREALTAAAGRRVTELAALGVARRGHEDEALPEAPAPVGEVIDEKAIINGVVALLATGGSTNHTLHLVAIAAAAGIELTWDDFADLSAATPLLTRIYPNGSADVNHFHAAGGTAFLISELLDAGLLHEDVRTVGGGGLRQYGTTPRLLSGTLSWQPGPEHSGDPAVLRPAAEPFAPEGGLRMVDGNLGRAVAKVSAVSHEHRFIEAPARVFDDQESLHEAFAAGELDRDVVVVVRYQGPRANGMPELHKLTPPLSVLLDRGHRVALITDGRMSGASGAVPAAIHISPEAAAGGPLSRVRDGDLIRFDVEAEKLQVLVPDEEFAARRPDGGAPGDGEWLGTGRELFAAFRQAVGPAERGARVF
jgi:phosphogluconate dehydratase